jgi:hypothetical protein
MPTAQQESNSMCIANPKASLEAVSVKKLHLPVKRTLSKHGTPAQEKTMTDKFDPETHKFGNAYRYGVDIVYPSGIQTLGSREIVGFIEVDGVFKRLSYNLGPRAPEHDLVPRQAVTGDEPRVTVYDIVHNDVVVACVFDKSLVSKIQAALSPPAVPAEPTDKDAMEALTWFDEENLAMQHIGQYGKEDMRHVETIRRALSAPAREAGLVEALRIFMNCAYPVSTEIDKRGYSWSAAYLDQAKRNGQEVLAAHDNERK